MTTKTISKKTQGAIAAVAGGALLLGTGATFAVWSADTELTGNAITTGSLAVEVADIEWTFTGPGGPGVVDTDFLMVPGHTVTGTGAITPELVGTGLVADLEVAGMDSSAIGELTVTWTVGTTTATGTRVTIPALAPGAGDVPVTVEIAFPATSTATMDATVPAAELTVTLTQVLPTP